MAWSQSDLDAIDNAIKSGALRVEYPNGGSVLYRSLADMRSIRGDIAQCLNVQAGLPKQPRRLKIYSVKDL